MSFDTLPPVSPLCLDRLRNRAVVRADDEGHRPASNLELLFDLIYVVAVSRSVTVLHHQLAEEHFANALFAFASTFFALWWCWMGFTWFSNAHDSDDVTHRLLTFVQMAGSLILAAGIPQAAVDHNFSLVVVGYAVARVGLITGWLRVARDQPDHRGRALRYAVGLTGLQALWIARIWLPDGVLDISFLVLVVAELIVPWWAVRGSETLPMHADHIAERYGLFTIILLGETVAAAALGFQDAFDSTGVTAGLVTVGLGALIMAFAIWWLYFDHPGHLSPTRATAFAWGYTHVAVFASLAALGAGLGLAFADVLDAPGTHHTPARVTSFALAVPSAGYLVGLALLMTVTGHRATDIRIWPKLAGAAVILAVAGIGHVITTVVGCAGVLVFLTAWMTLDTRDDRHDDPAGTVGQPVRAE